MLSFLALPRGGAVAHPVDAVRGEGTAADPAFVFAITHAEVLRAAEFAVRHPERAEIHPGAALVAEVGDRAVLDSGGWPGQQQQHRQHLVNHFSDQLLSIRFLV